MPDNNKALSKPKNTPQNRPSDKQRPERVDMRPLDDKQEGSQLIARGVMVEESFSGPLPHPRALAAYDQVLPGAAERILIMAEKQQDHRISLEQSVISRDIKRADLGLKLGFVLGLVVAVGAMVLIGLGRSIEGLSTLLVSLATLVGVYVYALNTRKKEREEKKQVIEKVQTNSRRKNR